METFDLTPVKPKYHSGTCFVCQNVATQPSRIGGRSSLNLQSLLARYVRLYVTDGCMCRNCVRKLETIGEKIDAFRKEVLAGSSFKRQRASSNEPPVRRPLHVDQEQKNVAVYRELFKEAPLTKSTTTKDQPEQEFVSVYRPILPKRQYPSTSTQDTTRTVMPTYKHKQEVSVGQKKEDSSTCKRLPDLPTGKLPDVTLPITEHAYTKAIAFTSKGYKSSRTFSTSNTSRKLSSMVQLGEDHLDNIQVKKIQLAASSKSCSVLSLKLLEMPRMKESLLFYIGGEIATRYDKTPTTESTSVLLKKDFEHLNTFSFDILVTEMIEKYPEFVKFLLQIMLSKEHQRDIFKIQELMPQLGFIFATAMKARNEKCSAVHHLVGCILADHVCDQKVYDRLNALGVSISYNAQRQMMEKIAKESLAILVDALKSGKYIKLIGDNLNFSVDTRNETAMKHKHMVHMFTIAALISENHFMHSSLPPQVPIDHLSVEHLSLSSNEYSLIANDMVRMIAELAVVHLPQLAGIFKEFIPKDEGDEWSRNRCQKTKVFGIGTWPLNEMQYKDDVQILEKMEEALERIYRLADIPLTDSKHHAVGGDLLTRERLSVAKLMRLGQFVGSDQFVHLSPIVFEFFHLGMNYLEKLPYTMLWDRASDGEIGTMACHAHRLMRQKVSPGKPYNDNRDYFLLFTNAYIVTGLCDFFGMKSINDMPIKNGFPKFGTDAEKWPWLHKTIRTFIDQYAFPKYSGHDDSHPNVVLESSTSVQYVTVVLANG